MSLSIALAQLAAPSWWSEPTEITGKNAKRKRLNMENKACLIRVLQSFDGPMSLKVAADAAGLTLCSARNFLAPEVDRGAVERTLIDGIVHVEWKK